MIETEASKHETVTMNNGPMNINSYSGHLSFLPTHETIQTTSKITHQGTDTICKLSTSTFLLWSQARLFEAQYSYNWKVLVIIQLKSLSFLKHDQDIVEQTLVCL